MDPGWELIYIYMCVCVCVCVCVVWYRNEKSYKTVYIHDLAAKVVTTHTHGVEVGCIISRTLLNGI